MMQNLLLLHGALSTRLQFDSLRPLLANDFEVEAINFSGHGGLNIPMQGFTFNAFANDILAYADKNKIEKLNLFGFSMGGYAALYFAKLYPNRVNKIFTLNVKFNWDLASTARETAMLDAEKMMLKVPGYANQLMMLHGIQMWKEVINQTSGMMTALSKDYLLTKEDYKQMIFPIRLAIGDRDSTSSVQETLDVYQKLPNASMWVLPNTNHPFEKINCQKLASEINEFFLK
jgi:pimeloyl-ACP methyl ester carboxylesterase